jgi:hypothetical protein
MTTSGRCESSWRDFGSSSAKRSRRPRRRLGWHAITYRHPEAGYFAGIFPQADRVVIVFEHGHALSDPSDLLETGTRKQVRTVTLHPSGRVPSAKLRRLLRSAVAYGLSRQASS